jgi:hypothetical protein
MSVLVEGTELPDPPAFAGDLASVLMRVLAEAPGAELTSMDPFAAGGETSEDVQTH